MTLVPRNRPDRLVEWTFGGKPSQAFDPVKYTRTEIAHHARQLRWKFRSCSDLPTGRDNKFVRFMIQWQGEMYITIYGMK